MELIKYNYAGGLGFPLDATSDPGTGNKWVLRADDKKELPTFAQVDSNAIIATELRGFDVPEPTTFLMLGGGLLALGLLGRRFRR